MKGNADEYDNTVSAAALAISSCSLSPVIRATTGMSIAGKLYSAVALGPVCRIISKR